MDYGYFGFNHGAIDNPDAVTRVVQAAEQLGYESVWTGEHVVLVDPHEPPSPVKPETNFIDTVASLAFAAAKTERIKLGSGIILLPQRNPVVLAKELAGIDVLSKGRLLFGLGVGYVPREFETMGVPYEERGARTTEHIEAIRELWTSDQPTFDGKFTQYSGIQSRPRPVQDPHPPIIVGGMSPPALRRAVAQGDGLYGFFQDLEATEKIVAALEETAKSTERREGLGRLTISITPPGPVDADTAKRFEDLGVDRLILMRGFGDMSADPGRSAEDGILAFLEEQAKVF